MDEDGQLLLKGFETDVYDLVPGAPRSGWVGLLSLPASGLASVREQVGLLDEPLNPRMGTGCALDWLELADGRSLVGMPTEKVDRWRGEDEIRFEIDGGEADDDGVIDDGVIPTIELSTRWTDWLFEKESIVVIERGRVVDTREVFSDGP